MDNRKEFEKEFLRVVAADLRYIANEWNTKIDDDSLRRDCVVLHKLLIDGNLGKAWRAVGFEKEPKILAPVLETISDRKRADFIQAGGAHYGGGEISNLQMYSDDKLPSNYAQKSPESIYKGQGIEARLYVSKEPPHKRTRKALRLSEFLNDICIIIKGIDISRNDLIVYVANTLGGKHMDWRREFKEQSKRAAKFEALDSVFKTWETGGKNSIYYELLSVGQALANSRDTHKLIKRIKETVGG